MLEASRLCPCEKIYPINQSILFGLFLLNVAARTNDFSIRCGLIRYRHWAFRSELLLFHFVTSFVPFINRNLSSLGRLSKSSVDDHRVSVCMDNYWVNETRQKAANTVERSISHRKSKCESIYDSIWVALVLECHDSYSDLFLKAFTVKIASMLLIWSCSGSSFRRCYSRKIWWATFANIFLQSLWRLLAAQWTMTK